MKFSVLFSIIFLMSSGAFAASKTKASSATTTSKKMTFSKARQKLKGFSAVGYFNTANQVPVKAGDVQVTAKSEGAFGLGMEYQHKFTGTPSASKTVLTGGLVYETPRELKSVNDGGQIDEFAGSNPAFSMLLGYTNIGYILTEQATFFGGLNFPVPFESNFGDVSLTGTLGYQLGMAMTFTQSFGADIAYRWINLKGNNGVNGLDVDGLLLQGRYIF